MEQRLKELEDRVAELATKEKEAKSKVEEHKQQEWHDVTLGEAKEGPTIIKLNVCGKRYELSTQTLLKHKGCFFYSQKLNPAEELFIERDPKLFRYVLSFLVCGVLTPPSEVTQQIAVEAEFAYFGIPFPLLIRFPSPDFNHVGDLIVPFLHVLKAWFPKHKLQLVYKATKNGFTITDFSRMCANRGATLTVIRSSTGYVFGGFSPLSWTQAMIVPYVHPEMCIFTLFNPFNLPPSRFFVQQTEKIGIQVRMDGMMPKFCFGKDISVSTNSFQNDCQINFPQSFMDTMGRGTATFTGEKTFTTSDIEVYLVFP